MVTKDTWYTRLFSQLGERYFDKDYTRGTEQEIGFLTSLFGPPQNQLILDLGCGPGRHSLALARRGYCMVGVDISKSFIQMAERNSEQNRAFFLVGDARQLPFKNHFDWIISLCEGAFGIMESDAEHQLILSNISRCLKPNGYLVLNALNGAFAFRYPQHNDHFDILDCRGYWTESFNGANGSHRTEECSVRYYTVPELRLLCEAAGLTVREVWGTIAGHYCKKALAFDDFEILLVAEKTA